MAAKKNVLGLIDAGREIRRPPLVGMQFLHQRAVRAADVLGARPRLQRQGSDRPPLRSFCRCAPRALRSPLPHHPARAHASRAPGGQDTLPVGRGCRSSISASRPSKRRQIERVERRALVPAGENAAAHRAGVVIELHFEEGRCAPARPGRCSSACAAAEARPAAAAPSRAGPARTAPSGIATPISPRRQQKRRADQRADAARRRAARRAACFGSALEKALSAHSSSEQNDDAEEEGRHGYLSCCEQLDRAGAAAAP